ncbi:MAG: hypothetical protein H2054_04625 [Sphingomonas sp.]|uniref:hypothetical protein n=3 Tax=Sphingomonas sp. TaxID=28214 RepID=UPI000DB2F738|nr:hypothetical protein [Sphingomonas sp.]PZP19920.1 MAG: hypothetical protein DI607_01185 [Sphingomonas hengshuiensis]
MTETVAGEGIIIATPVVARSAYVPITNRRRAGAILAVALVYAAALLLLLSRAAPPPAEPFRQRSDTITLLPLSPPDDPEPPAPPAARAPDTPAAPIPPPPPTRPAIAPPAATAPSALAPSAPSAPPPAAASPPGVATAPIIAGEGDAPYDLDTGAGGGAGFVPPRWLHKVTNDEFFPLVDPELLQASLEVDYRMQCTIALSTRVQCRVLKEAPFYPGLRRAVMAAVPLLRMAPAKRDGRLVDGQRVEFWWRISVTHGDVQLR